MDAATQALHKQVLSCFQAWVRLGTLHEVSPADSQHLVGLALLHLDDIDSPVSDDAVGPGGAGMVCRCGATAPAAAAHLRRKASLR